MKTGKLVKEFTKKGCIHAQTIYRARKPPFFFLKTESRLEIFKYYFIDVKSYYSEHHGA
jgi:hypothetical protein